MERTEEFFRDFWFEDADDADALIDFEYEMDILGDSERAYWDGADLEYDDIG